MINFLVLAKLLEGEISDDALTTFSIFCKLRKGQKPRFLMMPYLLLALSQAEKMSASEISDDALPTFSVFLQVAETSETEISDDALPTLGTFASAENVGKRDF